MSRIPLWAYLGFVLLLCVLFMSLYSRLTPNTLIEHTPSKSPVIDSLMKGVTLTRFDKLGQRSQELSMKGWHHKQGSNTSWMEDPVLLVKPEDGSAWEIKAKLGSCYQKQVHGKIEKLQLTSDVRVKRLRGKDDQGMELQTESLFFFPYRRLAKTSFPVTVLGSGIKIQAVGLNANLESHTIQFLKEVSSHYEKPRV